MNKQTAPLFSSDELEQIPTSLRARVAAAGNWQPIEDAPKDATPVDLWVPGMGRLVNMKRTKLSRDNVFYEAITTGYTCVRDATHFMRVPPPPLVTQ